MAEMPIKITIYKDVDSQQLRFSCNGGGPGGLEVIVVHTSTPFVDASKDSIKLVVWNPYMNKWVTFKVHKEE